VSREAQSIFKDENADTHISKELGLLDWVKTSPFVSNYKSIEKIRKQVEARQGINLPQKVAQHIARSVAQAWSSYFVLKKNSHDPRPPKYVQKYYVVQYTVQALSATGLRESRVIPTGWKSGVKIPTGTKVQAARAFMKNADVWLETIHIVPDPPVAKAEGIVAAVDLGVDVLAAVTFSDGSQPLLVSGKPLKSMNAYANKKNAALRSILDKEKDYLEAKLKKEYPDLESLYPIRSQKLDRLWGKRNRKINHYLHSASKQLLVKLVSAGVKEILVGWNDGFKQATNLGKKTNQNFVNIPHARFIQLLTYKAKQHGILVRRVEESYTSKASFLDYDIIPTYGSKLDTWVPSGVRTKRGLYKTASGRFIHADVNASYNILAKHATGSDMSLSRTGCIVQPVTLTVTGWCSKK
jgi:putative transposase